jgi:fido (protein-threonine AMPylation protein)
VRVLVPAVPEIDPALAARHAAAHARLAEVVGGAATETRRAFVALQRQVMLEGLVNLQSVLVEEGRQLVFPPPRGFLDDLQQMRLLGGRAAFRHIDSRVAMLQMGSISDVLDDTTHVALHAMFEGGQPSGEETNAGMLRATVTSWKPEANPFVHPDAADVRQLVAAAFSVARDTSLPSFARAAWLTAVMMSIHPFVDGNGRTSRALYMLVAAPGVPLGVDWGIAEQWSLTRSRYISALQAGQQCERYEPEKMDFGPFVVYSTAASIAGAELCAERVRQLDMECSGLVESGLSSDSTTLLMVVRRWINVSPREASGVVRDPAALDAAIAELRRAGLLEWSQRPHSRRTFLDRSEHGLVAVG